MNKGVHRHFSLSLIASFMVSLLGGWRFFPRGLDFSCISEVGHFWIWDGNAEGFEGVPTRRKVKGDTGVGAHTELAQLEVGQ